MRPDGSEQRGTDRLENTDVPSQIVLKGALDFNLSIKHLMASDICLISTEQR